ncbi:hypothetical protein [Streptomyces sp. NPDC057966]|uniref:hypothetical protein n=1 Tax=Streptomyces sp. NPDC057966 TaxID=3346292 RepID=UPI0036E6CB96
MSLAAHPADSAEGRAALALETAIDMTCDDVHVSLVYDTDLDRWNYSARIAARTEVPRTERCRLS